MIPWWTFGVHRFLSAGALISRSQVRRADHAGGLIFARIRV
jgi:hypothetical protein